MLCMCILYRLCTLYLTMLYRSNHTTKSSWDVAAGSILIEEAGGAMTDLRNERWNLRKRKICGSNGGKVHDQILEALGEAGVV